MGEFILYYNESCTKCPTGGICENGILSISEGYWRDSIGIDNIYACYPYAASCL